MKPTSKRRASARSVPAMQVVHLTDLGPKPDFQMVRGCFMSLPTTTRHVLQHWLAYHLACARADHEADPLAPANYRDHCCGRSTTANAMLVELRTLVRGEDVAALETYFGGSARAATDA